jgi:hypothetical protein
MEREKSHFRAMIIGKLLGNFTNSFTEVNARGEDGQGLPGKGSLTIAGRSSGAFVAFALL